MIHEYAVLGKRLLGEASQKHCDSLGICNGLSTYIRLLRLQILATMEFWIVSSCAWQSTCSFNAKHLKKVTPFPQVTASSHELILYCCVLWWIIVYSAYSIFRECSVDPSLLSLLSLVRVTNMTVELVMNTYFISHRQDILGTNRVTTGQEIFLIKLIMCNLLWNSKTFPWHKNTSLLSYN